jgi:hypothetical protein
VLAIILFASRETFHNWHGFSIARRLCGASKWGGASEKYEKCDPFNKFGKLWSLGACFMRHNPKETKTWLCRSIRFNHENLASLKDFGILAISG